MKLTFGASNAPVSVQFDRAPRIGKPFRQHRVCFLRVFASSWWKL